MKEHYWCLLNDTGIDDSKIKLAFKGNLSFSDTQPRQENPPHLPSPHQRLASHINHHQVSQHQANQGSQGSHYLGNHLPANQHN